MKGGSVKLEAQRCFEVGNACHPEIEWEFHDFLEAFNSHSGHLFDKEHPATSREAYQDEFVRLANLAGRPGANRVFENCYLVPLRPRIKAVCDDVGIADEAMQALREKLLLAPQTRLRNYSNGGCFRAWLRVVAKRTALDVVRKHGRNAAREVELCEKLVEVATTPDAWLLRNELREQFQQAVRQAVAELPERERYALRMSLVAGWSIDQIGRVFRAHRSTAARWLTSGRSKLERSVKSSLSRQLSLSPGELEHLFESMRSQLDLRASQWFQTSSSHPQGLALSSVRRTLTTQVEHTAR